MLKIKEYAESRGVSEQTIRAFIKRDRHKAALEGHIREVGGVMRLDDDAITYIDEARAANAVVQHDLGQQQRIDELEQENSNLKLSINTLQAEIAAKQDRIQAMNDDKMLMLEDMQKAKLLLDDHESLKTEVSEIRTELKEKIKQLEDKDGKLKSVELEMESLRIHKIYSEGRAERLDNQLIQVEDSSRRKSVAIVVLCVVASVAISVAVMMPFILK